MMENRSFDHMLGYLKLEQGREEVEGLAPGFSNTYNDEVFPVRQLTETKLGRGQDPCHDGWCVAEQLADQNGGFVANYSKSHQGDPAGGFVMGYFNQSALPTYDHLASEFGICDHWYSSVPGATWPNRLYALAGRAAGSKDNPRGIPKFNLPSFVRHLDAAGTSWKWYAFPLHPIGGLLTTLQIADDRYNAPESGNYARCDPVFFQDAANGTLPAVSWIDPDFGLPIPGRHENDDHPPADVIAGQEFVLKVYHALTQGPLWETTMLVVVYDEHGGFFDHVAPGEAQDDDPAFRQYGVRVPAFVISPWIEQRKVAHDTYDHTSIIKTILLRFARTASGAIPNMGARVANANHLGSLLSRADPRPAPSLADHQAEVDRIAEWHAQTIQKTFQASGVQAGPPPELTEFQRGLLAASIASPLRPKDRRAPKKRPPKKHATRQ
jgi:phospholipase C